MVGEGITQALSWLLAGDGEVAAVAAMTIQVSGVATLCSVLLGIPLGVWLALRDFRGKQLCSALVNFGMGLPPVVVGLFVSLCLCVTGRWENGN